MRKLLGMVAAALVAALVVGVAPAAAQDEDPRVLMYTGTTGYRHADAIDQGGPVVERALEQAGYVVDVETCIDNGGAANNCDNPNKNPRIFSDENLAQYDAILVFNASSSWAGGGKPGPLWNADQRQAIIRFVQQGGGIAANHNATDMGAGAVSWDWWDGGNESVVGGLMRGHAASSQTNVADVQVADHNHLATRELPDTYEFGDEHYNFARSVRGTHHVLTTLDERTYNPGGNAMGQDHPITWCKLYDGASVMDGTGVAKPYDDGRTWVTGMGHFGSSYTENDGDNELVEQLVGGVRWAAGEGKKSDCSGTVWSSFKRTILVDDINGPIGLDTAPDGKIYWSEIGPNQGYTSEGFIKVHDPQGEAGNKTTVVAIPTRADHGNSEDGVLGMVLEPGFDLSDPEKRDLFVYYSPRNETWPTTGNQIAVGYNQISRFTLDEDGTTVVPGSERIILRVPKAKISGSPSGFPGGPTDSGPGHVGGAGLDFDSEGNLYLGVGDDVSPNAPGHDRLAPMDYRAAERWDARKTAANTADLRGKVLRIRPVDDIPADTPPGYEDTYTVPEGNMFAPGTAKTRPEIYGMGFRQPFTVKADPANPGTVVVGEYCHDGSANVPNRGPAGVCEWNLVQEPGFHGWPHCMGDNSAENSMFKWDYANDQTTGQRYDCNQSQIPSDIRWAPEGQTAAQPTFDGLDTLPGPAKKATIWKKDAAPGNHPVADFGDLSAGGRSPVTGPVYRYDAETAGPGAFPAYYDGSWFITNRGDANGFWKEVQLRDDNNEMLRVNNWAPAGFFGQPNNAFVIPTAFGADGALYMAKWNEGCCRNQINPNTQNQLIKVEFAVQDECLEDDQAPTANHRIAGREHPDKPGTYLDEAVATLVAGDAGCAGIRSIEYRMNDAEEWETYNAPLSLEPGTYTIEYRATDRFDNVSEVREVSLTVEDLNDDAAPTVEAEVQGTPNADGYYPSPATVAFSATDGLTAISSIEYRDNQTDEWTKTEYDGEELTQTLTASFGEAGFHWVEVRATDDAGNVSEPTGVAFSVIGDCTYPNSDEFDGTTLNERWWRHERSGGTPATGPMAPVVGDGKLTLKTNDFELDNNSATTARGPVNFVGIDVPQLGDAWQVETQLTVNYTGGWQHSGLILWKDDGNFFRSTITHSLSDGSMYIEQSKDNPGTNPEGSRAQAGGNITVSPTKQPITVRMRYTRAAGSDTVVPEFRVVAPANLADDDWRRFGGAADFLNLNTGATTPRRDAEGSKIGILAGGNFPGTTGAHPYNGTPGTVEVDYFRVIAGEPVECPDDDVEAPTTTGTLIPAEPGPGGTYAGSVTVQTSATDGTDANATGIDRTEFKLDDGTWTEAENVDGTTPFVATLEVAEIGEHTVAFRSRDEAGNLEPPQTVEFTVEEGGGPGEVTDVFAGGVTWQPAALTVPFGETVTWHFDQPAAQFPHDVWLTPPGKNQQTESSQLTPGIVPPGAAPVSYTFRQQGTWAFVCRVHATYDAAEGEYVGMVGTVDVGEGTDPGPGPDPQPQPQPQPQPKPPVVDNPPLPPKPSVTKARLNRIKKMRLGTFTKRGVRVVSRCESGQRGTIRLELPRREARKVGYRKAKVLATKRIRCGASDRVATRVKIKRSLRRKLNRADRSLRLTVRIRMGSGDERSSHTRKVTLTKKKRR